MEKATIIGIDLAKRVFQVHGAAADGTVVFRKKLSRVQLVAFLARQPACTISMEGIVRNFGLERGRADS
jgi:transposase